MLAICRSPIIVFMMTFLAGCLQNAHAQSLAELLTDPNVVWVGEGEYNVLFENPTEDFQPRHSLLKFQLTDRSSQSLAHMIVRDIAEGRLPAYANYTDLTPTPPQKLGRTVQYPYLDGAGNPKTIFSWNTYLVDYQIIGWRIRQILVCDTSQMRWSGYVTHVGALQRYLDESQRPYSQPVFWIKPENAHPNLNDSSIVWSYRMATPDVSNALSIEQILVHKQQRTIDSILRFQREHFFTDSVATYLFPSGSMHKIDYESRIQYDSIFLRSDTLVQIQPGVDWRSTDVEADDYRIVIDNFWIDPNSATHIALLNQWAWDEQHSRLIINLLGVGPMYTDFHNGVFHKKKALWLLATRRP
jgi:hypothetical protein